jgi:RsiW-degrading membrane proteinase PrsW (M82 family)
MDGLVYGAAASLGFASLENLAFMLMFGPEAILVRGPLTTLAHLVLSSIWSYPLGQTTQKKTGFGLPVVAGEPLQRWHTAFSTSWCSRPRSWHWEWWCWARSGR